MKRQIKVWGSRSFALVLVVLAAQYWGIPLYNQTFHKKQAEVFVPTTKANEGKFTVSFHEIGTLEAEKSVPINTPTEGKIVKLISEGTIVSTGQLLFELDTTELQRKVRDQQLAYKNALVDVDRAVDEKLLLIESNKTEINKQKKQYDFNVAERDRAKEELDKQERLAKEQLVPGSRVDAAALALRTKELEVEKGAMDLELKKKEIESKEKQKDAEVDKVKFAAMIAKSNLEEVENRVMKAQVTAPASGMVVINGRWDGGEHRKFMEGDSVWPGQTIGQLPDLSSMLVKVNVGEADAPKVKVGLPALIRLDAVPKKVFHGSISEISKLAVEDDWRSGTPGKKNFVVTIDVVEADPAVLKPGMTADVEFIQDTIEKAVYLPIEAVTEIKGKTYVFMKQGKKWERVLVKVGRRNDNFVIIEKGVKKGDVVALRDPTRPLDEQEAGANKSGSE